MEQEAILFLGEILSIQTVNGIDNERVLAEYICRYLSHFGVKSSVFPIDNTHANVIAELEGISNEIVIWNGHLDTVPYGSEEEWSTNPREAVEQEGKLYARGASDMKSGLAGMVYALAYMKAHGIVPQKTIYFCGTCDEERNGLGARYLVEQNLLPKSELLLIGEPTALRMGTAHKGCLWIKLTVFGKTSHGAYPEQGVNAIACGVHVCEALKEKIQQFTHPILGRPTIQMTEIKGGIAPNMTPDRAEIVMDIRVIPGLTDTDVIGFLQTAFEKQKEKKGQQISFTYEILNHRKAIEVEASFPWVQKIKGSLPAERQAAEVIGINYFTDASILTEGAAVPVLLFGPGEPDMAHKPNEYVVLQKYQEFIWTLIDAFR